MESEEKIYVTMHFNCGFKDEEYKLIEEYMDLDIKWGYHCASLTISFTIEQFDKIKELIKKLLDLIHKKKLDYIDEVTSSIDFSASKELMEIVEKMDEDIEKNIINPIMEA